MQRPPRSPDERLFSFRSMGLSVLQGGTALAGCVGVFLLARQARGGDAARALTFASLVVSFVAIILTNRSWTCSLLASLRRPNAALWWVLGGTAAFLALALTLPSAQRLFHFQPVRRVDLAAACLTGFISVLWLEAYKAWRHRAHRIEGHSPSS